MYCEFFGFREKPFSITPNPRFIFLSKQHQEAFAHLIYGINNHAGFIELTGEVGTGKTTVLRTLLEQLDDEHHRVALIFNPCLSAVELLRSINREFAIPYEDMGNEQLLAALYAFLVAENGAGRIVALIIDEAQNLQPQVLEQIRLISNLETNTDKLIQIVLAGQPELEKMLRLPELRQLAQRITVRYQLGPLDAEDTRSYISHRLQVASGYRTVDFTPAALFEVYIFTRGVPRLINVLCDRTLLIAFTQEKREILPRYVVQAIKEIRRDSMERTLRTKIFVGMAVAIIMLTVFLIYQLK
jgi:general secretion pathway protein A